MIRTYERPFTPAENRYLCASLAAADRELRPRYIRKELLQILIVAVVVGPIFSYWNSARWWQGPSMVLIGGLAIYGLALVDRYRQYRKRSAALLAVREAGTATVTEVQASGYAAFEEFEDLGELFVFQVEPDHLLVLQGQEYYETRRFPTLSFSIVEIPGALFTIRPSGTKAKPNRKFGPDVMRTIPLLPPLAVISGTLDNVIHALNDQQARAGDAFKATRA